MISNRFNNHGGEVFMAKDEKRKTANFHIYDFMNSFGLKKSTRDVFALLYSFTQGEFGLYYGSQITLAQMLGISRRTVQRAYRELRERKLIEKVRIGKFSGIRCKDISTISLSDEQNKSESEAILETKPANEAQTPSKYCSDTNVCTNEPKEPSKCGGTIDFYKNPSPKYQPKSFGRLGYVYLTPEQYANLCSLVAVETVDLYIQKFELMLARNRDAPSLKTPAPHSHYRTIKSWLVKDFGT